MYPHRVGRYCYFTCGTYARNSGRCSAHRLREDRLEQLVLEQLRALVHCAVEPEQFARRLCVGLCSPQPDPEHLQQKLDRLAAQRRQAYADRLEGLIDAGEYAAASVRLRKKEEELRRAWQNRSGRDTGPDPEQVRQQVEEFLALKQPNRAVLGRLIRGIFVEENGGVELRFSFARPSL